jgi:hypothetical protein
MSAKSDVVLVIGDAYQTEIDGEDQMVKYMGPSKRDPHKARVQLIDTDTVRLVAPEDLEALSPAQKKAAKITAEKAAERKASKDGMTASERAMSASEKDRKATKKAGKATAKKAVKKEAKEPGVRAKRPSLFNAALLVLHAAKNPLNTRDIIAKAEELGMFKPGDGKTPEATLYSSFLGDKHGWVEKVDRGLWTITDAGKAEIPAIKKAFASI